MKNNPGHENIPEDQKTTKYFGNWKNTRFQVSQLQLGITHFWAI